jgi:hypothetical protein
MNGWSLFSVQNCESRQSVFRTGNLDADGFAIIAAYHVVRKEDGGEVLDLEKTVLPGVI